MKDAMFSLFLQSDTRQCAVQVSGLIILLSKNFQTCEIVL